MNETNYPSQSGTGPTIDLQDPGVAVRLRDIVRKYALQLENEMLDFMGSLYECARPVPREVEDYGEVDRPATGDDGASGGGQEHRSVHHLSDTSLEEIQRCRETHAQGSAARQAAAAAYKRGKSKRRARRGRK